MAFHYCFTPVSRQSSFVPPLLQTLKKKKKTPATFTSAFLGRRPAPAFRFHSVHCLWKLHLWLEIWDQKPGHAFSFLLQGIKKIFQNRQVFTKGWKSSQLSSQLSPGKPQCSYSQENSSSMKLLITSMDYLPGSWPLERTLLFSLINWLYFIYLLFWVFGEPQINCRIHYIGAKAGISTAHTCSVYLDKQHYS